MRQEAENILYWVQNELSRGQVKILASLRDREVLPIGRHPSFDLAYLIAIDAVSYPGLAITEKGLDGLAFWEVPL